MPAMPDALGKTLADTLYQPQPAGVDAVTLAKPAAPTFNLAAKTITIPNVTGVDYYEWRGIYGFVLVTGTVARSGSDDIAYPGRARIHARAAAGYALTGQTIWLANYS